MQKYVVMILVLLLMISACGKKPDSDPSQTPIAQDIEPTSASYVYEYSPDIISSSSITGEEANRKPLCFIEEFPPGYESSAAVQGMKLFGDSIGISLRYIYFPQNCSQEDVESDIDLLFFGNIIDDNEIAFFLLEPRVEGTLGKLYGHLLNYNFWAMGPEDYPMVLDRRADIETNIIIFRVDRMNGEGHEGSNLLALMHGMGEHEYIHTIQGRNNHDLSEMIWRNNVYRYYIENYANIRNNAGKMYYEASYTLLVLLQFLDGMNAQGTLEEKSVEILKRKGMDTESFLNRDINIYNQHIQAHVVQVADKQYLERLQYRTINPMILVEMAGSGDIEAYDVIRALYDENIGMYDEQFYGLTKEEYLPSFDELFTLQ